MRTVFEQLLLWLSSKKETLSYPISTLPLLRLFLFPFFVILFSNSMHSLRPPPHPDLLVPLQHIAFSAALHLQIITLLPKTPSDKQSMCACQ